MAAANTSAMRLYPASVGCRPSISHGLCLDAAFFSMKLPYGVSNDVRIAAKKRSAILR
jgi:hypothetical protein